MRAGLTAPWRVCVAVRKRAASARRGCRWADVVTLAHYFRLAFFPRQFTQLLFLINDVTAQAFVEAGAAYEESSVGVEASGSIYGITVFDNDHKPVCLDHYRGKVAATLHQFLR